jgi:hypothetical protein
MPRKSIVLSALLLLCAVGAQAQSMTFDQAAYVTCKEAQALAPDARKALALYLADHAARHRGVTMPTDARGTQIAYLVRGGCTLAPDAYLFTVIDRAIIAELVTKK